MTRTLGTRQLLFAVSVLVAGLVGTVAAYKHSLTIGVQPDGAC